MKLFKTALFTFYICIMCANNVFASDSDNTNALYSKTIKTEISKLSDNFNSTNVENLFTDFLRYKGIDDPVIAYAVVELALENKELLTSEIVEQIKKFSPSQSGKIEVILSNSFSNKLFKIKNFINIGTLLTFFKQIFGLFCILLFIYFLFKNFYFFTHTHLYAHHRKFSALTKIAVFVSIFTTLLIIFPHNKTSAFALMLPLLLSSEAKTGRYTCLLIIFIGLIFSSLGVNVTDNTSKKHYINAALKPASQEYLLNLQKKYPEDKLLHAIAYLKTDEAKNLLALPEPENSVEAVNFASVYLSQGKTEQFNRIVNKFNISDNPVILMNMNTFFMKNFMYDEYEQYIENLYNYPSYYNIFQNYQLKFNKTTYFPYYKYTELIIPKIDINWLNTFKYMAVFAVFLIIHFFLTGLKMFRCKYCGKVYCAKCNDNFYDNTCSLCYNIHEEPVDSDPHILTKRNIESENYKTFKLRLVFVLSLILPGSGLIYTGNIIFGIILTALFATVLYFIIFGFSVFTWPLNFGIQYVFEPAVIVLFIIFFIIYILSFVYLRGKDVS